VLKLKLPSSVFRNKSANSASLYFNFKNQHGCCSYFLSLNVKKKSGSDGGEYKDRLLDLLPRSSVDRQQRLGETYRQYLQCRITKENGLYFSPEDGGRRFLRSASMCAYPSKYTASHLGKQ